MESGKRKELFSDWPVEAGERLRGDRWEPAVDVYETERGVVVRVELAGVHNADLRVTVDGNLLRLRGVRRPQLESDAQRLHQMEIAFGPFERVVRIPVRFDRDRVSAHLEEGFLRVIFPKRVPVKRRIEVRTEDE